MGETLILFDVSRKEWNLDKNEQVRCLAYLAQQIRDFAALPLGVESHIIPLRYPSAQPQYPYPVLSLFTLDGYDVASESIPSPFEIETKIADFLDATGKEKMLELAATQTLTWQDVLEHSNEADVEK